MEIPWDEGTNNFLPQSHVTVSNGETTSFWESMWLEGTAPKAIAPRIYEASRKKRATVKEAITSNQWIANINIANLTTTNQFEEYVTLWEQLQGVALTDGEDTITWTTTARGVYTAKSAYQFQFNGSTNVTLCTSIWKPWGPPKCKFFAWLAVQNKIWTADRLERRGWNNQRLCPLY